MRALRFSEFGAPTVLTIEEVSIPDPGKGEALVQVKAAAINPSDVKNVSGFFKSTTLPRTPGRDFAGVVVKGKPFEGQEVWGSVPNLGLVRDGAHAEFVVVPAASLSLKPKSLSMAQAAVVGVPFITAWAALVNAAQLEAGESILIVGAGGATGQAATQIANWRGARVMSAVRGSGPIPGAAWSIDTDTESLPEKALELTGGRGVDAVFDTVGGLMFEPALQCIRVGGRQVAITSTGDPRVSFNLVDFYHHCLRLLGVDSNKLTIKQVTEFLDELRTGFETGALMPPPIEIVEFDKAIDAYNRVAGRLTRTKQVLSFA